MKHGIDSIGIAVLLSALLCLFSGTVWGNEREAVSVGAGSLRIGGNYQTSFAWYEEENIASEFRVVRARLMLHGTLVPDQITYFVQADAAQTPYLLDSRLTLHVIPKTSMSIGRFVPQFTLYMPHGTAQLDFVNYPATTTRYAMWRQIGVQFTTRIDPLNIYYGVFNGYGYNPLTGVLEANEWRDTNDAKDFLLSGIYRFHNGMRLGVFGWWGHPFNVETGDDFDISRFGAFFDWRHPGFHLAAEYVAGKEMYDDGITVKNYAAMIQGSVIFNEYWELLARYEAWDPDTDIRDNGESCFTAGVNYSLLNLNTKIFLNYIAKMEEGRNIKDDSIVLQAQFSF